MPLDLPDQDLHAITEELKDLALTFSSSPPAPPDIAKTAWARRLKKSDWRVEAVSSVLGSVWQFPYRLRCRMNINLNIGYLLKARDAVQKQGEFHDQLTAYAGSELAEIINAALLPRSVGAIRQMTVAELTIPNVSGHVTKAQLPHVDWVELQLTDGFVHLNYASILTPHTAHKHALIIPIDSSEFYEKVKIPVAKFEAAEPFAQQFSWVQETPAGSVDVTVGLQFSKV